MRCLVLGGAGFLGHSLSHHLAQAGHEVRVFDRFPISVAFDDPAIEVTEGDFLNAGHLDAALADIEVVFHLISTTIPGSSNKDPVFDVQTNVCGSIQLIQRCAAAGQRVIFASSGGTVYGPPVQVPIPEDHPNAPICSYGIAKLTIEKYLNMYEALHGLDYLVLRIANPYGRRPHVNKAQGAIDVFFSRALSGEGIEIWGDGSVVRDYVFVDDVSEAFLRALEYRGPERVFNIGSGDGYSLTAITAALEKALGKPLDIAYKAGRAVDVPVNVLDSRRAATELAWRPRTSLDEGLRRMVERCR